MESLIGWSINFYLFIGPLLNVAVQTRVAQPFRGSKKFNSTERYLPEVSEIFLFTAGGHQCPRPQYSESQSLLQLSDRCLHDLDLPATAMDLPSLIAIGPGNDTLLAQIPAL